ncbi:MAG: hypothetical protein HY801_10105, partial [Candidatus Lindowbacteria bacterium]|nr:hypothetical protein [Candidatus Lindowbacteria bacterium]
MSFEINLFLETAQQIYQRALADGRLTNNPEPGALKQMVENEEGITVSAFGSFCVDSEPNSRAAQFTKNNIDDPFGDKERELLRHCEQCLSKEHLVSLDFMVGNGDSGTTARVIVPDRFVHLVYAGENQFGRVNGGVENPTHTIIFFIDDAFESNRTKPLPSKDITIRLAFLPDGRMIKIIRNSNYFGELKKGIFAAE